MNPTTKALFAELSELVTEERNPSTTGLDRATTDQILRMISREDLQVARAVRAEIPFLTRAVEVVVGRLSQGGRLFYVGAGTSGRLGVLDAAECPPTFGTSPEMVQGIIAGGPDALQRSIEGAEDDRKSSVDALKRANLSEKDVVVGLSACRLTPFVVSAVEYARSVGAATLYVCANPREHFDLDVDVAVCPVVGPEVILGSTRMKAGTAQKMILNMLSTATMVRLGKVYQNLMVDLKPVSRKLEERAKRLVMIAAGVEYDEAAKLLEKAGKSVKVALVMHGAGVDREEATKLLEQAEGFVHRALDRDDDTERSGRRRGRRRGGRDEEPVRADAGADASDAAAPGRGRRDRSRRDEPRRERERSRGDRGGRRDEKVPAEGEPERTGRDRSRSERGRSRAEAEGDRSRDERARPRAERGAARSERGGAGAEREAARPGRDRTRADRERPRVERDRPRTARDGDRPERDPQHTERERPRAERERPRAEREGARAGRERARPERERDGAERERDRGERRPRRERRDRDRARVEAAAADDAVRPPRRRTRSVEPEELAAEVAAIPEAPRDLNGAPTDGANGRGDEDRPRRRRRRRLAGDDRPDSASRPRREETAPAPPTREPAARAGAPAVDEPASPPEPASSPEPAEEPARKQNANPREHWDKKDSPQFVSRAISRSSRHQKRWIVRRKNR